MNEYMIMKWTQNGEREMLKVFAEDFHGAYERAIGFAKNDKILSIVVMNFPEHEFKKTA